MKYENLQQLMQNSRSSRAYFLSLPVQTQCRLHTYDSHIHSAAELHSMVRQLDISDRQADLGGWTRMQQQDGMFQ
ncbi:hypothetical protein [Candidatus Soleaferrea massiliensis]|uniref:hypothetical protein n=1 Tax=Candidatus Soleaferrea massiliensis TaxID=1470354 RepID=UPI00058EE1E0|nr:hypothetical protein [Candidatus Soleaferrea massiliensis]